MHLHKARATIAQGRTKCLAAAAGGLLAIVLAGTPTAYAGTNGQELILRLGEGVNQAQVCGTNQHYQKVCTPYFDTEGEPYSLQGWWWQWSVQIKRWYWGNEFEFAPLTCWVDSYVSWTNWWACP